MNANETDGICCCPISEPDSTALYCLRCGGTEPKVEVKKIRKKK